MQASTRYRQELDFSMLEVKTIACPAVPKINKSDLSARILTINTCTMRVKIVEVDGQLWFYCPTSSDSSQFVLDCDSDRENIFRNGLQDALCIVLAAFQILVALPRIGRDPTVLLALFDRRLCLSAVHLLQSMTATIEWASGSLQMWPKISMKATRVKTTSTLAHQPPGDKRPG